MPYLILTAEDETADGKVQARMNVIHEAGLFQGQTGIQKGDIDCFKKVARNSRTFMAWVNFDSHGENIKETFEEIRQLLEERHNIAT